MLLSLCVTHTTTHTHKLYCTHNTHTHLIPHSSHTHTHKTMHKTTRMHDHTHTNPSYHTQHARRDTHISKHTHASPTTAITPCTAHTIPRHTCRIPYTPHSTCICVTHMPHSTQHTTHSHLPPALPDTKSDFQQSRMISLPERRRQRKPSELPQITNSQAPRAA